MSAERPEEPRPLTLDLGDPSRSIELVREAQSGNQEALNELFTRYRPRLVRIIEIRMGPNLRRHLEADDVVQEVLIVASRRMAEFELRSHAGILKWLERIADNRIKSRIQHLYAGKRDPRKEVALRQTVSETSPGFSVPDPSPSPSSNARRAEFEAIVDRHVRALEPDEYREVILLRDYYQEEWEDVRRTLQRPTLAATQELYRRAHKRLVEKLGKYLRS